MEWHPSAIPFDSFPLSDAATKEPPVFPRYPLSPSIVDLPKGEANPIVSSEPDVSLSSDNSLISSSDESISKQSAGPTSPRIETPTSVPVVSPLSADPFPLVSFSSPLRHFSPSATKTIRPLPFPVVPCSSRGPRRNPIVRSYALVEQQGGKGVREMGRNTPAKQCLQGIASARKKAVPYTVEDPLRDWRPHIKLKRVKELEMGKQMRKEAIWEQKIKNGVDNPKIQQGLESMMAQIKIHDSKIQSSQSLYLNIPPPHTTLPAPSSRELPSHSLLTPTDDDKSFFGLRRRFDILPRSEEDDMLLDKDSDST